MSDRFLWLADRGLDHIRKWTLPNEYTTRTMTPIFRANLWMEVFGYVCAAGMTRE